MAEAFSYFTYNNNLEKSFMSTLSQILQESKEDTEHEETLIPSGFWKQSSDENTTKSKIEVVEEDSVSSHSNSATEESEEESEQSSEAEVVAKVVPLLSLKKNVQFTEQEQKREPDSDTEEESDIKEVNINEDENTSELYALVKQLVLLENEDVKAQQFLAFIQKHECFDKQDYKAVHQFLELIKQEKKSLVLVLSNYGSHIQPLITMMTIAERRLSLLDSTNLITPGSTLHNAFLDKQRALQDIIQQAEELVYSHQR